MKIAITGATGFLGVPLVQLLMGKGHEVTALVRDPSGVAVRALRGARIEVWDGGGALRPGTLLGHEAVIHLAGESIAQRWTAESKAQILESRRQGTARIVEAALEGKTVRALLSASAVGYYGPQGTRSLGEEDPPGDDYLAKVCLAWEQATAPAAAGGIRTVLLRTGVVLHPDGGALKQMLRPFRLGVGGRLGSGEQYMSWIHREDWLSLCAHCLHAASLNGPVNLTAPNPVTNRELTSALGVALHRPTLLPAPAFALKLALGEMSTMLLEGQRVLPKRALEMGFRFKFERIDDALSALLPSQAA
jgi:uncharacterized protein (TIGR01777 family)